MERILNVHWDADLVGKLKQDEHGILQFQYESSWLKNDNARPISYSFPLSSQRFQRPDCVAFFSGLLPEREKRQRVARNLGLYESDDFSLLQHLGGDCAGALTFSSAHEDPTTETDDYCFLTVEEMTQTLDLLPDHPLLAGASGIRLSLAGTQPKVPAYVADNNAIGIPLESAASSHIIKLPSFKQPSSLVNEAFCLSLARLWGVSVVDAHLEKVEDKSYLLVKRYDRLPTPSGAMERLHQEDFCQALGICAEEKYQTSFQSCFDLVRRCSSVPVADLLTFFDYMLFNFLIGNNQAHGKNFALLHTPFGARLAPLYGVYSTVVYSTHRKEMAMAIGGEFDRSKVNATHWKKLAAEIDMSYPLVKAHISQRTNDMLKVLSALQIPEKSIIIQQITKNATEQCRRVLDGF